MKLKPGGKQALVIAFMQNSGEPANTHDLMSGCRMESRQVASTCTELMRKGLLTRRTEPAMLKGQRGTMHKGKLRVYELTEEGREAE